MSESSNFCTDCGAQIGGARFCASCGRPSGVFQAVTPAAVGVTTNGEGERPLPTHFEPVAGTQTLIPVVPQPAPPPPEPPRRGGPSTTVLLIIGGVALAAALAIAALLLLGGNDSSPSKKADTEYQEKIASAFGPVLGANLQVSDALNDLSGRDSPADAKLAVSRAQEATTTAQGAVGALTVPKGSEQLSTDAGQVLVREAAYLAGVSAVLNHPSVAGAAQLQTLSSNLDAAFDAAGPTVAGKTQTVDGVDRLTSWARTASKPAKKSGGKKSGGKSTPAPAPAPAPALTGRNCGDGVRAGSVTSCEFAFQVRSAYADQLHNGSGSVRAHSPVTGKTYTMRCRPTGSRTLCTGGNNASVTF